MKTALTAAKMTALRAPLVMLTEMFLIHDRMSWLKSFFSLFLQERFQTVVC
jgi:hypothetical protein